MMDLFEHAPQRDYGSPPDPTRAKTRQQEYDAWKQLPGSGHVLRWCNKFAAVYWKEYERYGVKAGIKLIFEQVRHRIRIVRAEAERKGFDLKPYAGYVLNNSFTGYVARTLIEHHPKYEEMFELRELRATRPIVK